MNNKIIFILFLFLISCKPNKQNDIPPDLGFLKTHAPNIKNGIYQKTMNWENENPLPLNYSGEA